MRNKKTMMLLGGALALMLPCVNMDGLTPPEGTDVLEVPAAEQGRPLETGPRAHQRWDALQMGAHNYQRRGPTR